MSVRSEEDAYLAALIDEKGAFRTREARPGYWHIQLRFRRLRPETSDWLVSHFPRARNSGNTVVFEGSDVEAVVKAARKYLMASQPIVPLVLEFTETYNPHRGRVPEKDLRTRERLAKRIRKIAPDQTLSTVIDSGLIGARGIAVDKDGSLVVADARAPPGSLSTPYSRKR